MSDRNPTRNLDPEKLQQAGAKRAFLVVLVGQSTGLTVQLENERTIIGRGSQSGIVLKDDIASREHAAITRTSAEGGSNEYHLSDLASTNGTFLNETRVTSQQPLRHGDKIRIGTHLLKFAMLDDVEAESLITSKYRASDGQSPAPEAHRASLHFSTFHISPEVDILYEGDTVVPLEARAVRVLRFLVEHHDRVVSKEELLEAVWPDVFTADGVLKAAISKVRRALGDDAEQNRFIETYHGRGYRFIADVELSPKRQRRA